MMPRPTLPRAKEIADIAKLLRAEGFNSFRIDAAPDGRVSILAGETEGSSNVSELDLWKAKRGAA